MHVMPRLFRVLYATFRLEIRSLFAGTAAIPTASAFIRGINFFFWPAVRLVASAEGSGGGKDALSAHADVLIGVTSATVALLLSHAHSTVKGSCDNFQAGATRAHKMRPLHRMS
jgi:hypothetical protein